jgi:hypothetical protein
VDWRGGVSKPKVNDPKECAKSGSFLFRWHDSDSDSKHKAHIILTIYINLSAKIRLQFP